MATVNVTGTLSDFGLQALVGRQPRVVFRPNGPGFSGAYVLATPEIIAIPDSAGDFFASLEPANRIKPYRTFTVRLEWMDSASNFVGMDLIEEFKVPPQGGPMGDLAALGYDPTSAWVDPMPPVNPAYSTWWLNSDTGELLEWE